MRFGWTDFDKQEREIHRALRSQASGCPAPDTLRAFDQGALSAVDAGRIREHLEVCRICTVLARDLAELPVPPRSVERRPASMTYLAVGVSIAALVLVIGPWRSGKPKVPQAAVTPTAAPRTAYRLTLVKAPLKLPLVPALAVRGQESSAGSAYLKELGDALDPYYRDQFDEAERRLESLAARHPASVEPVFYLGVARLMRGDAAAARDALEKARKLGSTVLDEDTAWYLAVALERDGGFDLARPLLERLCANSGSHKPAACGALASAP